MLIVIFCEPVLVGNFGNTIAIRISAGTEAAVSIYETGSVGISGFQLVQNGRYIGFSDGLAIGERTASGRLGDFRLGSGVGSGLGVGSTGLGSGVGVGVGF